MNRTPNKAGGRTETVRAGDTLNIYTAEAFAEACRAAVAEADRVVVDLSAVERCDTIGLQVLLALERSALARGRSVEFTGTAASVRKTAASVGLERDGISRT